LAVDARCPECGQEVLASVFAAVDPEADRWPPLPRPRASGLALFALVVATGCAIALSILLDPRFPGPGDGTGGWGGTPELRRGLSATAIGASLGAAAAAFRLVLLFGARFRFARRRLAGTALLLMPAVAVVPAWGSGPPLLAASLLLWALDPFVRELGARSVRFRRGGAARQPTGTLALATGLAGLAATIRSILPPASDADWIVAIASIVLAGLACLGFGYLALNTVWIARSLALRGSLTADGSAELARIVRFPPEDA